MQARRIEKLANAFVPGAEASDEVAGAALRAIDRHARKQGGLWVGGKVVIGPGGLSFAPNRLNSSLHAGLEPVDVPLRDIRSVHREFGWLTGIVVVEHVRGEFRFRCFGARGVAEALRARAGVR